MLPAQVGRLHAGHIGVLTTAIEDAVSGGPGYRAFQAELERLGFAEGRNLVTEIGRTDQGADRTFADAAAMARANVAVIISSGADVPSEAALAASPTIPIVMLASNYDPIARGYVASLARPAGVSRASSIVSQNDAKTRRAPRRSLPGNAPISCSVG